MATGNYDRLTVLSQQGMSNTFDVVLALPTVLTIPGIPFPVPVPLSLEINVVDDSDPTAFGDQLDINIEIGFLGNFDITGTYAGVPDQSSGTADNIAVSFSIPQTLIDLIDTISGGAIILPSQVFAIIGNDVIDDPTDVLNETITLCLVSGTMIRTPKGDVPIETLSPGDYVLTPEGPKSVVFRGETTRPVVELLVTNKMPVRVRKGAFGEGLPQRDTFSTPSHAFALKGCLIESQALINDSSVSQMEAWEGSTVTYHSLELEAHHLIWANGLLTESFIELNRATGSSQTIRASWSNWSDYLALYSEAKPMDEMVMPRIPFARQLTPELRSMIGLEKEESAFALAD